jgi:hypothetical protein
MVSLKGIEVFMEKIYVLVINCKVGKLCVLSIIVKLVN